MKKSGGQYLHMFKTCLRVINFHVYHGEGGTNLLMWWRFETVWWRKKNLRYESLNSLQLANFLYWAHEGVQHIGYVLLVESQCIRSMKIWFIWNFKFAITFGENLWKSLCWLSWAYSFISELWAQENSVGWRHMQMLRFNWRSVLPLSSV